MQYKVHSGSVLNRREIKIYKAFKESSGCVYAVPMPFGLWFGLLCWLSCRS
jgi:hypothetical protein